MKTSCVVSKLLGIPELLAILVCESELMDPNVEINYPELSIIEDVIHENQINVS